MGLADRAVVRRGEEYTRKGTLTGRKQGNQANHYTTEMQKLVRVHGRENGLSADSLFFSRSLRGPMPGAGWRPLS